MTSKSSVIHLHQHDPQEALAKLNRITGLRFARWPESLLAQVAPEHRVQDADDASQQPPASPEVSSG